MHIAAATRAELPDIHAAYEHAREIQSSQHSAVWPPFTDVAVTREIDNGELYTVRDGDALIGVFSLIEADGLLWGADERGEHLYLHRIARSAISANGGFIDAVIAWTFRECAKRGRIGVRMDTWASNHALIALYERRGFRLVDARQMPADPRLSPHYHGTVLALLEAPCPSDGAEGNSPRRSGPSIPEP